MKRKIIYYTLILPISTIILLELSLQTASFVNRKFFSRTENQEWLTSHLRIVTMGDSNTYGLYLDSKESYPKQLETIWNKAHENQKIEVINLGYPGANSSRIVANIEAAINNLHPDIITIMIGTNDSWTMPISAAENSLTDNNWRIFYWIQSNSRIYRIYCILTRNDIYQDELKVVTTSDPKQSESAKGKPATIDYKDMHLDFSITMRKKDDVFNSNENTLKNLKKLMDYARNSGQRIIFLTYPGNKGYYKLANNLIKEAIQKNQYPYFIDITPAFYELQPAKGQGNEYFFADLHASAISNELVAKQISQDLTDILQAKQGTPTQ